MFEFEEDNITKLEIHLSDCVFKNNIYWPIIVITYNECIFSANNGIQRV